MSKRRSKVYLILTAATAVPRLAVLVIDRADLFGDFTEKSAEFAKTYAESGTFGFIPGEPSAYTQPLYAFFLTPLYELFGESWAAVGGAQTAVAIVTAIGVFELARRLTSWNVGLVAALITTLHPYLVWHDVHVNREILDHALAVGLILTTVGLADRVTWPRTIAFGILSGCSVLANVRLALLPIALLAYVAWRHSSVRRVVVPGLVAALVAIVIVAPWVARNRVVVGCWAVTTDARALWKANNERTYNVVSNGGWIDDVPSIPGSEPSPQSAGKTYRQTDRIVAVDECAQMRFYREEVLRFWREQPAEKLRLAALATKLLWSPRVTLAPDRPGRGGFLDFARAWSEPAFAVSLFALGILGVRRVPGHYVVLAVGVLAYQTLIAALFMGSTRYRVTWDFLVAIPAAAFLAVVASGVERRRTERRRAAERPGYGSS